MVLEYRANWTYGGGSPGVSVFHGRGATGVPAATAAQDLADRVGAFFSNLSNVCTIAVDWDFPAEVTDLNTTTGVLEAVHAVDPPSPVGGTIESTMATPAGVRIAWTTTAIVAGRRLRGATFVVPVATALYEANGTIASGSLTQLAGYAEDFIDNGVFSSCHPSVWSRTHGIQGDMTGFEIPDRVAVLRSRRD